MAAGRPTKYNQELVSKMCERIACGESVRSIVSDEDMPAMATFFRWLHEKPEFKEQYAMAKELGAEALFADILSISDDGSNDWMEKLDKDGQAYGWSINGEAIQRSRLRVDSRKWYLSKVLPKVYGDKVHQEISGELKTNAATDEERADRITSIFDEARTRRDRQLDS